MHSTCSLRESIKCAVLLYAYVARSNAQIDIIAVLALIIVPAISLGIRAFGKYLRELSHKTQAAAAVAASIAEVELITLDLPIIMILSIFKYLRTSLWFECLLTFGFFFVCSLQESFGAVRTVRSFANEDYERARYAEKVDVTLQLGLKQAVRLLAT